MDTTIRMLCNPSSALVADWQAGISAPPDLATSLVEGAEIELPSHLADEILGRHLAELVEE